MICKKCANMFDDSLSSCPECGTPVFTSDSPEEKEDKEASFVLNIPDEEIEKPIIIKIGAVNGDEEEESLPEASKDETDLDEGEASEEEKPQAPQIVRKNKNSAPVKRIVQKKAEPEEKKQDTVGDKAAAALIVSIVCILACVMTVLTFVSVKSDIFKSDGDVVKTVAMSSLSGEQKGELEQWFSRVGVICEDGIDTSLRGVDAVLELMKPYDSDGIYSSVYGKAKITANIPDPAHRYMNENGDYSYYKLEGDKIDALADALGYIPNHTVNTPDFYYYGGYYYFRDKDSEKTKLYIADVGNSKRIMDGSYYVECSFLDKNDLSSEEVERYAIVEKLEDNEGVPFRVKMLSDTPVFDESGIMIHSSAAYKMKTYSVEKKAKDGTVYHKYIIEYPEFSGSTEAEKTANQLFGDMINVYGADDESADKAYKSFIENGGDKNELPLVTHIVSRVTYCKGGYLSFMEETAEYVPASMPKEDPEGEDEEEEQTDGSLPVILPKRTVEGYNLDTETGDFVTKDAIIGKNYQNIAELLYRIYKGYSYEDLKLKFKENLGDDFMSEEVSTETDTAEPEDVPEDSEGLGMKIYESASALTEKGYMFCFVTEEGYAVDVVIPTDIQGLYVVDVDINE